MKKHASIRQTKYAVGLMNTKKSKYRIALEAGFSPSTARVPKLIENKQGFSLAMASLAGETGNVAMKMVQELKSRDMSKEETKMILYSIEILSRAFERFIPKDERIDSQSRPTNRLREIVIAQQMKNEIAL
jgi:predicted transcriptional regulator